MAIRKKPLAAGLAALMFTSWASALGLGDISLNSSLNEPLDAEIKLLNIGDVSDAEMLVGLASARDFNNAGVEREFILTRLKFDLDLAARGGPVIRVTSKEPIREPYLDFLVDVEWTSGRLLREYTLLLDLPVFSGEGSAKKSRPSPSPSREAPKPASVAPQQSYPQQDSESVVAGGETYTVDRGDTLWGIASRMSGEGSVHSKMAAIHSINPNAFINGDINLIKRGHVLRLPQSSEVAAADSIALKSVLDGGTAAAADEKPLWDAAQQESTEQPEAALQKEPVEDSAPRARLSLSAIGSTSVVDDVALSSAAEETSDDIEAGSGIRSEIDTIQEELDKTQRENSELRTRLANLEDQLNTMQRIVELGDNDMRAAQVAAAQNSSITPSAGTSDAAQEKAYSVAPADQAKQSSSSISFSQDKGWFETMSSYMAYALGIIVILIGAIIFAVLKKRRRDAEDETAAYAPPERKAFVPYSPDKDDVEEEDDDDSQDYSVSSMDEIELREGDDLFPESEPEADLTPVEESEPDVVGDEVVLEDDLELDLSEFDLGEQADEAAEPAVGQAQSLEDELNLDEFDLLGGADAGDTQLELAQAYMDMGDNPAAKEILQEVLDSGSDEQKQKAQALLAKLG
jgi:pilus assembly protein FimV